MWTTELLDIYDSADKQEIRDINIDYLITGQGVHIPPDSPYYMGIKGLRSANVQFNPTYQEVNIIDGIKEDPMMIYSFFRHLGLLGSAPLNFILRDYQKDIISKLDSNRFNIFTVSRQMGMSRTVICHVIDYVMKTPNKKVKFVICNPSESYNMFFTSYADLPFYIKIGIEKFRKDSFIEFENGSVVHFSDKHVVGVEYDYLILADFSYHPDQDDIWMGVTAYLSKDSRICIYGTPNGSNDSFAKIYLDKSHIKSNIFQKHKYTYDLVPNRDSNWEANIIKGIGIESFVKEYECHFPDTVPYNRSVALYNVLDNKQL